MKELKSILYSLQVLGLSGVLDALRTPLRDYYTQDLLSLVNGSEWQPYDLFPEQFDLTGTGFWGTIKAFDRVVLKLVEKQRRGLTMSDEDFWKEYGRRIYAVDDRLVVGPIVPGGSESILLNRKTIKEPPILACRVFHHRHPTNQAFAPMDLGWVVRGRHSSLQDPDYPQPPLRLMSLSTPEGSHYLAFPSQETPFITREAAKALGMVPPPPPELYQSLFANIWAELKSTYDLSLFIGENIRGISAYPPDANEEGIALITMADALRRSRNFSLPIYHGLPGSSVFKRIRELKDVYPQLKPR